MSDDNRGLLNLLCGLGSLLLRAMTISYGFSFSICGSAVRTLWRDQYLLDGRDKSVNENVVRPRLTRSRIQDPDE